MPFIPHSLPFGVARDIGIGGMQRIWKRITFYRHRSELLALRLARKVPVLAMLPISVSLCLWWVIAGLFGVLPIMFLLQEFQQSLAKFADLPAPVLFGFSILKFAVSVAAILIAMPWGLRWYSIAASLMFGHSKLAEAKEAFLTDAIRAYRDRRV